MRGQLDFDGEEIQAIDVRGLPGARTRTAQSLGLDPDLVRRKDRLRFEVEYKVTHFEHGAADDGDGFDKAEFAEVIVLSPIQNSVRLIAHLSRDEVEAAWQTAHTG